VLALGAMAVPAALAQVNGANDAGEYGAARATQNVGTGFGNNFSELNAAFATWNPGAGTLRLLLTGNLEGNGNGIVLFMDTRAGGAIANTLPGGFGQMGSVGGARIDDWGTDTDGGPGVTPTPGGGSVLSPGFNPDLALEINSGGGGANYFINVIDLTIPNEPNPDKDIFLGQNATNGPGVTQTYVRSGGPRGNVTHAFNNTNTAGVNALGDPPGDPLSATTGLEFEFDTTFLNLGAGVNEVRFFAFVTNGSGDFLSNQFLPGIGATSNLGGPGGVGGTPLFDIREFANSTSFFTVTVPEPASLSVASLAGVCLLARRRAAR
jgi:hypothetical protein